MKASGDITVIAMMLAKAREKLKTAQIDFDNERYDDTVSRAYYAVYHTISAALLSKGLHFSSHGQTIGAFNREFVKTKTFPASFTKMIEKLYHERQTGDYDFESHIDEDVAEEDLNYAKDILKTCEEYLAKAYRVTMDYWEKGA
ncbi:MAG: HEPN domain-containing protein [Deltaproteobacteria bacterium]|nr:HEPN domain-containing protein [Deltaproteobacteria bacterium]